MSSLSRRYRTIFLPPLLVHTNTHPTHTRTPHRSFHHTGGRGESGEGVGIRRGPRNVVYTRRRRFFGCGSRRNVKLQARISDLSNTKQRLPRQKAVTRFTSFSAILLYVHSTPAIFGAHHGSPVPSHNTAGSRDPCRASTYGARVKSEEGKNVTNVAKVKETRTKRRDGP